MRDWPEERTLDVRLEGFEDGHDGYREEVLLY